jgi:hypothetical protein
MAAVSELLLKKRKRQEAWAAEKATAASAQKKNALAARKTVFKRAEAYAKEYRAAVRSIWARNSAAVRRSALRGRRRQQQQQQQQRRGAARGRAVAAPLSLEPRRSSARRPCSRGRPLSAAGPARGLY